jgi:hypothetical protein
VGDISNRNWGAAEHIGINDKILGCSLGRTTEGFEPVCGEFSFFFSARSL